MAQAPRRMLTAWRHFHGQIDQNRGAACGTRGDLQPAAKLGHHQRADDLQAEAGGFIKIESRGQPGAVVRHRHDELLRAPLGMHGERPG